MKTTSFRMLLLLSLLVCSTHGFAQPAFPPAKPPPSRAVLLEKFDRDRNGQLNDAEREVMRKERFAEKQREEQTGRGGFRPQFPPDVVKKFDKNGNGELDDQEMQAVFEDMRRRMEEVTKKYDKNGNRRLDDDELEEVRADVESGKLTGLPPWFGARGPGMRGAGGARRGNSREEIIRKADANSDGKLDENELRAAREALGYNAESRPVQRDK